MMQFVSAYDDVFCSLTSSWAFNVPSASTYEEALRQKCQTLKKWVEEWKAHSFCRVVPNANFSSDTTISRNGPFGESWTAPVLIGSDTVGRGLPWLGCFGGRGKPRSATRGLACAGSGGRGRDWSTIERRASTHAAELASLRPSEMSQSPTRSGCEEGAPGAPATANARCHSLPRQPTSNTFNIKQQQRDLCATHRMQRIQPGLTWTHACATGTG